MGYRTLEISHAAEIHIKEGQLEITTEEGIVLIPIEDLCQIMVHGANIRLSTMDMSILSQNKVALMTLDEKYLHLWMQIIKQKISNQSRALSIMRLEGAEEVAFYVNSLNEQNVDYNESLAAKKYFAFYHGGLNRRTEDPINSRLNYGYAVVRSAIARKLVATGFHPTFGVHHNSQLNAFNLADDLIEPYRAMVDLVAHENIGSNVQLSKQERKNLAHVLHNACIVDGTKVNIMSAIEIMAESLKRIILDNSNELLKLPIIIPIEEMEGITE